MVYSPADYDKHDICLEIQNSIITYLASRGATESQTWPKIFSHEGIFSFLPIRAYLDAGITTHDIKDIFVEVITVGRIIKHETLGLIPADHEMI